MNSSELTEKIREAAKEYGADVVGFGDPDRWNSAPFSRTPRALMADCKATVSIGIHYLDSCIELGGSPDPRYPGPAVSNHIGSEHCNYAAYRLCKFIEGLGYQALMVPSTGWWNYRENEDSPRGFSGDITHYYAAVAAGFGEIGWNNLCLTPEFGPRQRLATVVTNAPLTPDPMYHGEPLCDRCGLCAKKCPGEVFEKESNGPMSVTIGDREFTFQHKNLWRCACGENFQLDSFMKRLEVNTEETVLKLCEEAAYGDPSKRFTWKMGMCLKWCVPPRRRYMDRGFAESFRRRRNVSANFSEPALEKARELLKLYMKKLRISDLAILSLQDLEACGIESRLMLPNCKSAIAVLQRFVPGAEAAVFRNAQRNALWLARRLEIDMGYDTLIECGIQPERVAARFLPDLSHYKMHLILSNIPFSSEYISGEKEPEQSAPTELESLLRTVAAEQGAELFGISSSARLDQAADQLDACYRDTDYFVSDEKGWGVLATKPIEMKGKPKNPAIRDVKLICKRATDYVADAKSVIVLGTSFLNGSVKNAGKGPAPKAAHYGVTVHKEMILQNENAANELALLLEQKGYHAVVTSDLDGLASLSYSWLLPGIRANAIPALCAGLGTLGKNGLVINKKYGSRVRYVAVVTDAPLSESALADEEILCGHCDRCIKGCPAEALSSAAPSLHLNLEGKEYFFAPLDRLRCDWASRYGLLGDEGPKYLGCTNDFPIPEQITRENLLETVRSGDRLQITNFAPIVEHCLLDCPYNDILHEE